MRGRWLSSNASSRANWSAASSFAAGPFKPGEPEFSVLSGRSWGNLQENLAGRWLTVEISIRTTIMHGYKHPDIALASVALTDFTVSFASISSVTVIRALERYPGSSCVRVSRWRSGCSWRLRSIAPLHRGWDRDAKPVETELLSIPAEDMLASAKWRPTVKARWICEQAHQQLKEELGLDHFEGRSWQAWILEPSATGLCEPDLHVFAKAL